MSAARDRALNAAWRQYEDAQGALAQANSLQGRYVEAYLDGGCCERGVARMVEQRAVIIAARVDVEVARAAWYRIRAEPELVVSGPASEDYLREWVAA